MHIFYYGDNMSKLNLRKKYKITKINILTITIILLIIITFYTLKFVNKEIVPYLLEVSNSEVEDISTIIIQRSITDDIVKKMEGSDLYQVNKDSTNNINSVDFNMVTINMILTDINNNIKYNMKLFKQGKLSSIDLDEETSIYKSNNIKKGIIYEIPSGIVFKNTLLSNLGPKIPVRIAFNGNVSSNLKTKVKNYGINNSVVEVSIHIETSVKTILPFVSDNNIVKADVPISIRIINGSVPHYYSTGLQENSPIISSDD